MAKNDLTLSETDEAIMRLFINDMVMPEIEPYKQAILKIQNTIRDERLSSTQKIKQINTHIDGALLGVVEVGYNTSINYEV
jgi:hypothetical protein